MWKIKDQRFGQIKQKWSELGPVDCVCSKGLLFVGYIKGFPPLYCFGSDSGVYVSSCPPTLALSIKIIHFSTLTSKVDEMIFGSELNKLSYNIK